MIRKILGDYIPEYGKPKGIRSDHGKQFTSEKSIKVLENEGIKPIFPSIRHPQSNLVEWVHRELGRFFRTFVKERHTGWEKYLDVIQKIINETHYETTGFTPIELHLNIKPTRVWEKWIGVPPVKEATREQKIFLARDRSHRTLKNRARRENKDRKHFSFNENDLVLVKVQNQSNASDKKLAKFFHVYEGPYIGKWKVNTDT